MQNPGRELKYRPSLKSIEKRYETPPCFLEMSKERITPIVPAGEKRRRHDRVFAYGPL
jgi:hypothetical protein